MERKFTDDEIVNALRMCNYNADCDNCPCVGECWDVNKYAIDLINRQKAEIERLTEHNKILMDRVGSLVYECDCAKQESIKEFAERLKQYCAPGGDFGDPCGVLTVTDRWIDHLVKELTGENNGN